MSKKTQHLYELLHWLGACFVQRTANIHNLSYKHFLQGWQHRYLFHMGTFSNSLSLESISSENVLLITELFFGILFTIGLFVKSQAVINNSSSSFSFSKRKKKQSFGPGHYFFLK